MRRPAGSLAVARAGCQRHRVGLDERRGALERSQLVRGETAGGGLRRLVAGRQTTRAAGSAAIAPDDSVAGDGGRRRLPVGWPQVVEQVCLPGATPRVDTLELPERRLGKLHEAALAVGQQRAQPLPVAL